MRSHSKKFNNLHHVSCTKNTHKKHAQHLFFPRSTSVCCHPTTSSSTTGSSPSFKHPHTVTLMVVEGTLVLTCVKWFRLLQLEAWCFVSILFSTLYVIFLRFPVFESFFSTASLISSSILQATSCRMAFFMFFCGVRGGGCWIKAGIFVSFSIILWLITPFNSQSKSTEQNAKRTTSNLSKYG